MQPVQSMSSLIEGKGCVGISVSLGSRESSHSIECPGESRDIFWLKCVLNQSQYKMVSEKALN